MSVDDIAQKLNETLDKLPIAALTEATALIDEAADSIYALVLESNDPDIGQVCENWRQASREIAQTLTRVKKIESHIKIYASEKLGAGAPARPPAVSPRPNKAVLSKETLKAIETTRKRLSEHEDKLERYKKDPLAYDDGRLRNAPNEEIRNRIYLGRIAHLEAEIETYRKNISKYYNGEL